MPPEKPTEKDHSDTVVLRDALLRIGVSHWKPILGTTLGFLLGVASVKIELADALSTAHDAKEAVTELRGAIKDLATERELQDTNRRVDDVVSLLSHASKVAEEPPNGKSKTTRK